MKYSREGPRDFVPFEYEEVTIDNIKKACQKHFKEHRNCDVLASEQGPSCSRIDQLPSLKIIHIRFTNDLSRKRPFPEISSFPKTSDILGIPSKHPKSFSVVSKQSRNILHLLSQEVYQQRIRCDWVHLLENKIRMMLRLWLKVLTLLRNTLREEILAGRNFSRKKIWRIWRMPKNYRFGRNLIWRMAKDYKFGGNLIWRIREK